MPATISVNATDSHLPVKANILRFAIFFLYAVFSTNCVTMDRVGLAERGPHSSDKQLLPVGVSLDKGLTEKQAVWIGLLNNAAFREALTDVGLAESDILQARTLPNPTLSMLFPAGPKQLEFAVKYPVEAIWLRPKRVEIAEMDAFKTSKTLQQSSLDLIRDVRIAFANLNQAKERVQLAKEALDLSQQVAKIVDARYKAGAALQLESTTAKSDELQAEQELARLEHGVSLAKDRLAKLLGIGLSDFSITASGFTTQISVPENLSFLLKEAFAARPDLRAAEIAIESAVKRAGLAKAEAYNLTGVLDTNGSGGNFEAGPGIDLPIPIFNRNPGGKVRANIGIQKASMHYLAVRDQIILEVREAHTLARQAQRSAETWKREIIPPLEDAIHQADTAYRGGTATFLQVVETNRKLTTARLRYSETRTDLHRAITELEHAIGHHPLD